jgi:hypothetical protein
VESTNKVIEAILTKIVQLHHKDWVDRFPEALWAYRTSWRNTTGHTPYELVYGKQVLASHRISSENLQDCHAIRDGFG